MSEENQPTDHANVEPNVDNLDMSPDPDTIPMEEVASDHSDLSEVDQLRAQLADAEKRVLMAHADMENYRKRARRDMQDQVRYAALGLMGELLESVDNLHRAVEAYEKDPNGDGLSEGVKIVAQQITAALGTHGCKKIEAVGQTFDPNLHQALQMQPSDQHDANTVMMDLRSGFQLHDRLIRPSQVFVSTGPAAAKPNE